MRTWIPKLQVSPNPWSASSLGYLRYARVGNPPCCCALLLRVQPLLSGLLSELLQLQLLELLELLHLCQLRRPPSLAAEEAGLKV